MPQICAQCKSVLPGSAKFCPRCGSSARTQQENAETKVNERLYD